MEHVIKTKHFAVLLAAALMIVTGLLLAPQAYAQEPSAAAAGTEVTGTDSAGADSSGEQSAPASEETVTEEGSNDENGTETGQNENVIVDICISGSGTVDGQREDFQKEVAPGENLILQLRADDDHVIGEIRVNDEVTEGSEVRELLGSTSGELRLEELEAGFDLEVIFMTQADYRAASEVNPGEGEQEGGDDNVSSDGLRNPSDDSDGGESGGDADEDSGVLIGEIIEEVIDQAESAAGDIAEEAKDTVESESSIDDTNKEKSSADETTAETAAEDTGNAEKDTSETGDKTGDMPQENITTDDTTAEPKETSEGDVQDAETELAAEDNDADDEDEDEGDEDADDDEGGISGSGTGGTPRTGDKLPAMPILMLCLSLTLMGILFCRNLQRQRR